MFNLTAILEEVNSWDDVPELDYHEECLRNYPDDHYLMEGIEGSIWLGHRYEIISSMNKEYWRWMYA